MSLELGSHLMVFSSSLVFGFQNSPGSACWSLRPDVTKHLLVEDVFVSKPGMSNSLYSPIIWQYYDILSNSMILRNSAIQHPLAE